MLIKCNNSPEIKYLFVNCIYQLVEQKDETDLSDGTI